MTATTRLCRNSEHPDSCDATSTFCTPYPLTVEARLAERAPGDSATLTEADLGRLVMVLDSTPLMPMVQAYSGFKLRGQLGGWKPEGTEAPDVELVLLILAQLADRLTTYCAEVALQTAELQDLRSDLAAFRRIMGRS